MIRRSPFTTAQAARLDIPRDALAYAARAGRIERVAQGVYRLSATPDDGLDELRAIWKLTAPAAFSHERAKAEGWDGVVICGPTAAYVLRIGDFYAIPYHVAAPRRIRDIDIATDQLDIGTALRELRALVSRDMDDFLSYEVAG